MFCTLFSVQTWDSFDIVLQDGVPNTETWVDLGEEDFCGEFPRDRFCGIPVIKVRKEIRVVIVSQTLST